MTSRTTCQVCIYLGDSLVVDIPMATNDYFQKKELAVADDYWYNPTTR